MDGLRGLNRLQDGGGTDKVDAARHGCAPAKLAGQIDNPSPVYVSLHVGTKLLFNWARAPLETCWLDPGTCPRGGGTFQSYPYRKVWHRLGI